MDPSKLPLILELLQDDPDDPVLLLNAGKILLQTQQDEEALIHLRRLAEKHPTNMAVYRELGAAFLARGETRSARQAFEMGRQVSLAARDPSAASEYESLIGQCV